MSDVVHIDAPPEDIFEWLRDLDKNYRGWHRDHVKWEYLDGFREGGGCYCEETLHGRPHRMKGRITKLTENELVEFEFDLPTSLVCPGGSFIIEPEGTGSTFTATLSFRFGGVLSRLAKRRLDSVKGHMEEEGENLKRILEGSRTSESANS